MIEINLNLSIMKINNLDDFNEKKNDNLKYHLIKLLIIICFNYFLT